MVALFKVKKQAYEPPHRNYTRSQSLTARSLRLTVHFEYKTNSIKNLSINKYAWVNDSPYFGLVKLNFITRKLYLFSIVNYAFKLCYRNKSLFLGVENYYFRGLLITSLLLHKIIQNEV